MQVAYGWAPDSDWGTSPLWQANLNEGQTLKNASYHYLITDHLGTPQLAINSAGEQSWKITSDAFGNSELDANNQITMNLRFPGQYYDEETGLSYNYFRDYDAKTGRYIQNDPIGLAGGVNTYGYVGANPLLYIDIFGLSYWDCILNKSKKAYDRGHEFGTKTGTALGAAAGGAIGMVVGGGLSGAGCTMVLPVVGTVGCGASGAAMGGAAGATAGAIVGGTMGPTAIGGFKGIAGGLAGIVSWSSSDDGGEKYCEETEKQRCRKVKYNCLKECSDDALPTKNYGTSFRICVR
ncbi:RHS repeat domain-containing protein [Snodgrassella alvi]|uniref:RHS repeat domain-containing protein n=1 Tax=Snodgrassella alvi TaxID=1196083 RepID=UPI00345F4836